VHTYMQREAMRMEGVTRAGLLVKPKSAFARDGKTKLRPEIVEERHKAHLAEQGENARVVLETRAELVLKQQQKEQAQREIRATAREERRKARRQARRREMEEQGQQYDSDEFEVDEGADTVTEAESIRDAEDARALKMEDEDRKFAEKRVGSSAGNWILDCLARFGGGVCNYSTACCAVVLPRWRSRRPRWRVRRRRDALRPRRWPRRSLSRPSSRRRRGWRRRPRRGR
jgi:hypothetical protein